MWIIPPLIFFLLGAAVIWVVKKDIKLRWFEWLLTAVTILLLGLTILHYLGSVREYETTAATLGAVLFLVPALIIGGITFMTIWRANRAAG